MPNKILRAQRDAANAVLEYHHRSKHHLQRYANGPGTLDWDHQPNPFRYFEGTRQFPLPLTAKAVVSTYQQIYKQDKLDPAELTVHNLGIFFELSFALSAWKQYGTARWSLRCNPSSGNLHPTEVYAVLLQAMNPLTAGVYHYCSELHALEQRCGFTNDAEPAGFLLGLSSVTWREAWKYGERAFRYCQLDIGHAIACANYAAACLGWKARVIPEATDYQIGILLGLSRAEDFSQAETELPEVILWVSPEKEAGYPNLVALSSQAEQGQWQGQANLLDPHPVYEWPVIDDVAQASEKTSQDEASTTSLANTNNHPMPSQELNMSHLILKRRSAQAYDRQTVMHTSDFVRLLSALSPQTSQAVWCNWPYPARVQPVFFVHRVEGLMPGLYIQLRDPERLKELRSRLNTQFDWQIPNNADWQRAFEKLDFYHLLSANAQSAARKYACHQEIASDGAFSVAMLAPVHESINEAPWYYRQLYWEAGILGQIMYLEAEASGLRGTGIGCFFDDAIHQVLGIQNDHWQCLYQFTVGGALNDMRLISLPPYPDI